VKMVSDWSGQPRCIVWGLVTVVSMNSPFLHLCWQWY